MVLATLRFRGYSLKYNPIKLEIKNCFEKCSYKLPERGTKVVNVRRVPVVCTGVGEFCGEDCIEQYRELENLFNEGRKGVLALPGMRPYEAWFTSLEFVGDDTKDVLTYRFEFTQADTDSQMHSGEIHICKEGETLYDIAYEYGVRVENLVKLNPYIRRPDELKAGEQVRLC